MAVVLAWCAAPARAVEPEELLKAKGLTKVGQTYVVEGDAKLGEGLRDLRVAQKRLAEHAKTRSAIDWDIRSADAVLAECAPKIIDLGERYTKTKDAVKKNNIRADLLVWTAKKQDAERFKAAREKDLKLLVDPREDYVTVVLELSAKVEAAAKRYEALAADKEVSGAIERLNANGPPRVALGPSPRFATELPLIRKQRATVGAAAIPLEVDGNTATVQVLLNGKLTERMLVDSGATWVTLPWAVAQQIGMTPGPNDPVSKMSIADGSIVEARVMTLKTVRVGQFTAEDVQCVVMPKGMKNAPMLLGGAFLKHFVYRMDLAKGELHLTQVTGKPDEADEKPEAVGPGVVVEPGFAALFNGKDIDNWVWGTFKSGNVAKEGGGCRIDEANKVLAFTDKHNGRLFTAKEYGNFVLRFDVKLAKGGRGGVALRAPLQGDPAFVGLEVQLLDEENHKPRWPSHHHGSLFDLFPAKQGHLKPLGQWNAHEIAVDGRRVRVTLNGTLILDVDLDDQTDPQKLKTHPGLKETRGHVGLIGEGGGVEFRNVRIKELP